MWLPYASIAPVSWLVQYDVDEGRAALDFSEWHRRQEEADEAADVIREGDMPPLAYRLAHAPATAEWAERDRLARGLAATITVSRRRGTGGNFFMLRMLNRYRTELGVEAPAPELEAAAAATLGQLQRDGHGVRWRVPMRRPDSSRSMSRWAI